MKIITSRKYDKNYKRYVRQHYSLKLLHFTINVLVTGDNQQLKRLKNHKMNRRGQNLYSVHIGHHASDLLLKYTIDKPNKTIVLLDVCHHDKLNKKVG